MAGKLISDLNSGTLSLADAMEIDKDVSGTRTSYKTTVKDIVDFANHNVAEEYDSTSTYAVDDYVIYESVLYKCIGTTTGTFDSTKWTSVVVTDEMGSGGGGGTGGHTIIDENDNSMTARSGLQFTGDVVVTDDGTNNKTIVSVISGGGHNYSTTEHIVGTWIDGITLYEKTYDFSSNPISIPSGSNFMTSDIDSSNMGVVTNVFANHLDGTLYNDMSADPTGSNHTKLKLKSVGGATAYYLTLQYTKTS